MADLDFAGLGALAGVDNWQEKRQAKEADQQRLYLLNAMQNQELQQQQQSGAAIQEYLNTVGKIKVLDQDKKRIEDKDHELSQTIQEGIKKYQGNAKKYLMSGGLNELNKYRENLLNSKEVEQGLMNAVNYNRYVADKNAGLTPRPVAWQSGDEMKQGDFMQQYQDYTEGKTPTLNYSGGFKLPAFNEKPFQERYGNPNRTYQPVNAQDFYNEALMQFKDLPENDRQLAALYHTKNYVNRVREGGAPLAYKFDDPNVQKSRQIRDMVALGHLQVAQQKLAAAAKVGAPDFWGELASGGNAAPYPMKFDANSYAHLMGQKPNDNLVGQQVDVKTGFTPISDSKLVKDLAEMQGLTYDKKENAYKGKLPLGNGAISYVNGMPLTGRLNDIDYDVKNVQGIIHVPSPDNNPALQKNFVLVDVNMSKADADNVGLHNHHTLWWDSENALSQGHTKYEGKGVTIPLLVPIQPPTYETQIFNNKYKKPAEQRSAYGEEYNLLNSPAQQGYLGDGVINDADTGGSGGQDDNIDLNNEDNQ